MNGGGFGRVDDLETHVDQASAACHGDIDNPDANFLEQSRFRYDGSLV